MCSKEGESPTDKEELGVTDITATDDALVVDGHSSVLKEKKKKKHHRGEKRKRSCSTDSTSSASSHKKHKKKKKKKNKDDPPSPKVNPIFLWVKQEHTKIVEVLCEDYDKRNRIKLTKTAGGWVAIPRTNMFCPETSKERKEEEERKEVINHVNSPKVEENGDLDQAEIEEVVEEKPIEVRKEPECTEIKCCPEVNLDENHNNEVETPEDCLELCKNLEDDVEEVKVPEDTLEDDAIEIPDDEDCSATHQENCVNLMNELADMCFVENLKEETEDKVLDDIYTFVPSPAHEKEEVKSYTPIKDVKKPPTPEPSPMNLVVHPDREEAEDHEKDMKLEPLKQSDLESLDIMWRLPEGTTISHSKPLLDAKPAMIPTKQAPPTFTQPIQEEPLNLGKPKPKEEKKQIKPSEDSKLMELLKSDERIQSNPLDQLKEVLSDPDLSVPDPLLVPRARLSALIANPAKEIPKLLALKREVKYPKFDPDLMVVSLAHLQSILQKTGKDDDLKLYQQQMLNSYDKMDSATAALNQMLWLPYLSQLEAKHNQEQLMAMLAYPHYVYPQHYTATPPAASYPYPRPAWPRAETSKPRGLPKHHEPKYLDPKYREHKYHEPKHFDSKHLELKHHELKHPELKLLESKSHEVLQQQQQLKPESKPKLKVRDNLMEPKLKVRDNLVEPNQRTSLLKFDPTSPFLPPVGVPPNSNLWHPLFSSPDGNYTSRWNWTTPVTVSGE